MFALKLLCAWFGLSILFVVAWGFFCRGARVKDND
jgi:hypothetical protein